MSEQLPQDSNVPHEDEGWRAVAEQMHEWHPGLQEHAKRNLAERGLTHLINQKSDTISVDMVIDEDAERIETDIPQLTQNDKKWIEALAFRHVEDEELESVNRVIETGSRWISRDTDPDTVNEVVRARKRYFEDLLGWGDEQHPLHGAYVTFSDDKTALNPLNTQIKLQRMYYDLGIDAPKVLTVSPYNLTYAADSIKQKFDNLATRGINAAKAFNEYPRLLQNSPENISEKIDNLTSHGIDAVQLVNKAPGILGYSPEAFNKQITEIEALGIDAIRMAARHPQTLSLRIDNLASRVEALRSLGIDASKIINDFPGILAISAETVQNKVSFLNELGVDTPKVLAASPVILSRSTESVEERFHWLNSLGIDAIKTINNATGAAINLSTESIQEKIDAINGLGIDAAKLINVMPASLGLNIDSIRAKFYLLMQAGYISDSRPFPIEDASTVNSIMMLPNESIVEYLRATPPEERIPDIQGLRTATHKYMRDHGITSSPARKEHFESTKDDAFSKLGHGVNIVAMRNGTTIER